MKETIYEPGRNHVPYALDGTTIYIGKGEKLLTIDAETEQTGCSKSIDIRQDKMGTLGIGEGIAYAAIINLPPARYRMVDTGTMQKNQQTGKDEPVMKQEKLPIDTEEIEIILYPLEYEIETKKENETTAATGKED